MSAVPPDAVDEDAPTADGADEPARSRWLVPPGGIGLLIFVVLVGVGVLSGAMALGDQKVVLQSGGLHWAPLDAPGLPDDVAITIGRDRVTDSELATAAAVRTALTGDDAEPDERQLALAVAVGRVLEAEAARRDIFVTEKQAASRLDAVVEEKYDGDRDALLARLADEGVSTADLDREVRHELQAGALLASVAQSVESPTPDQAQTYFDDHKDELTGVEYRAITNAVMKTEEGARKVVARFESGETLPDLARRYSQDDVSRPKHGDLGLVTRDRLVPDYADAAFSAEPGTVFGPIETPGGWNVGEVREVVAPGDATFDDVEPLVAAAALAQARLDAWDTLIAGLLGDVDVRYADAYRPDDPDDPDLALVVPLGLAAADTGTQGDGDDTPEDVPGGPGSGPMLVTP